MATSETIRITKTDISTNCILTVAAFIKRLYDNDIPQSIQDLIIFMYAKPIIINIKHNNSIQHIFYCPITDNWDSMIRKIKAPDIRPDIVTKLPFTVSHFECDIGVIDKSKWTKYKLDSSHILEAHFFPGDGIPDKTPDFIEFKWKRGMSTKPLCDTLRTLYLLQCALNAVRKRTIERNSYFKAIQRTDRYIFQLDAPRIISNFIEWHQKDKNKNKFDGILWLKTSEMDMINNIISKIGQVKLGPATNILMKFTENVKIDERWRKKPQPTLKLANWGYTEL